MASLVRSHGLDLQNQQRAYAASSQLRLGTDAMFAIPPGAALDVGSDLLFDYVPGGRSAGRLRRATEVEGTASRQCATRSASL